MHETSTTIVAHMNTDLISIVSRKPPKYDPTQAPSSIEEYIAPIPLPRDFF